MTTLDSKLLELLKMLNPAIDDARIVEIDLKKRILEFAFIEKTEPPCKECGK